MNCELRLGDHLGEGGYGNVFQAIDEEKRTYAVKRIELEDNGLPCLMEASILSSICHENLMGAFAVVVSHGCLNLVQPAGEYDLLTWRERTSQPNIEQIRSWAHQILEGLNVLHRCQIIHADMKAANVVIVNGVAKITDFSLSRPFGKYTGSVGTTTHRPPESWKGDKWDEKVDIFGFGCILFEMLYGTSPFPHQEDPEAALNCLRHFSNAFSPKKLIPLTDTPYLPPILPNNFRMTPISALALRCLNPAVDRRPSVAQILSSEIFVGRTSAAPARFTCSPTVPLPNEKEIREEIQKYIHSRSGEDMAYQLYNRSIRLHYIASEKRIQAVCWIAGKLTYTKVYVEWSSELENIEKEICENLQFQLHLCRANCTITTRKLSTQRTSSGNERRFRRARDHLDSAKTEEE